MNRRQFQFLPLATLPTLTIALPAQAQGTGHRVLAQPAPVHVQPPRIEVVEFFWYGCPHCNAFAPLLESWVERLSADVVVTRAPVSFRPSFVAHQRLYFSLEAMDQVQALHRRVFRAIHVDGQRLDSESSILAWVRSQRELDAASFTKFYHSFSVANKVTRATRLQDAYGVSGVPALGVAGRFYTDGGLAGDMPRALAVVDRLIEGVRHTERR